MTINVTNVDEDGAVTLSPEQPKIGTELTAALTDADGGVSDASWRWERSQDNMTWTAISGATSNTYAPVGADEGNYLRATVVYTDGHGSGKGAQLAFADPVPLMPTPEPTAGPRGPAGPRGGAEPAGPKGDTGGCQGRRDIRPCGVEAQRFCPLKCQGKMSSVARARAIRWTLGIHVLPHGVSVYTQLPGDPTNGQSLALRLLHRFPPGRL